MSDVDWSEYSKQYDATVSHHPPYQEMLAYCLEVVGSWPLKKGAVVADLGAGTGNFSTAWAKMRPDIHVLHVENDRGMNARARNKSSMHRLSNWEIVELDLNDHAWHLPKLSAVLTVNTLYTLHNPQLAIRNIGSILEDGGYVLAADLGRVINMKGWTHYLFLQSLKTHGVLQTLMLLRQTGISRRINHQISEKQASGAYWTHELSEFRRQFEQAGIQVEHGSDQFYRGISDLIFGRKRITQ